MQGLSTALLVLDEALLVSYLNPAAESLFGISLRRTVGRGLAEVVHPAQELLVLCQRAFATGLSFSLHEFTARIGDRVLLWGRGLAVEEIAGRAGTISYDLTCGMTKRVLFVED